MVESPVGIRCPECGGRPTGLARVAPRALPRDGAYVTKFLIGANVAVFLLQAFSAGGSIARGVNGSVAQDGWLIAPGIADGEWWRIVTSAFLHGGLFHLFVNMLSLWILGSILEPRIGALRFVLIYLAAVVCGSFGATLLTPFSPTVGASGGVFGLMAAILVLQWQQRTTIAGDIGIWLILNLVITFTLPNISIGGHIGGIVGGAAAAFLLSALSGGRMGRRLSPASVVAAVGVIVVGVAGTVVTANAKTPDPFATGAPVTRTAAGPASAHQFVSAPRNPHDERD
jgi:membrane associated rhomboid family serine protease